VQHLDIAKVIKNYRKRQETYLIDGNFESIHYFVNPTEGTPVETSRFLRYLDLEWVDPVLKESFPHTFIAEVYILETIY